MSSETIYAYATQVVLNIGANTAQVNSTAFSAAPDASLAAANHFNYPWADFVLTATFASAVGAGALVYLYRRDIDIDGTADAAVPSANLRSILVGKFDIPNTASSGSFPLPNVPLSAKCEFYLENVSGQNMSAGWTLKATPKTYVPGA
jgi:hypothetical protein